MPWTSSLALLTVENNIDHLIVDAMIENMIGLEIENMIGFRNGCSILEHHDPIGLLML